MIRPVVSETAGPAPPARRPRRDQGALVLVASLLFLGACRVDAEVAVTVERGGRGSVTVTLTADAELVADAPGLAEDFRDDDLVAAGWNVDGPTPTVEGGLQVVLAHPFGSIPEANALLAQLSGPSGPLPNVELTQDRSRTRIATAVSGSILVTGTRVFADAAVLGALGDAPYEALLRQRGLTLAQALGLRFEVTVPGEVSETDGTADPADTEAGTTTVRWTAALDGQAVAPPGQPLTMRAVLDDAGARRAQRLRDFALWMIPAWLTFFALVILPVVYLRRRR